MSKAAIYDRGSTKGQEDNYSRANAKREGIAIAERNGFEWEYHKEIKSGSNLARREVLLKILDRVANGEIQAIIVQDLDRLARPDEAADFETIKNICERANVKVYTQSTIYDWRKPDDVMMGRFKSAIAGRERDYITERSIRGKKEKASEGGFLGGHAGLGYKVCYKLDDKGKRSSWLEVEESERELTKLLFELYILHGASDCARRLNELGYSGKNGAKFKHQVIIDTIKNPLYAGYVTWGEKQKQSKFLRDYESQYVYKAELQIVPLETWEKAQEVHKKRNHNLKADGSWGTSPFTGFLACEDCGAGMGLKSSKQKNGRVIKFYQCMDKIAYGKKHCNGKTHTLDLVAQGIIPFMVDLLTEDLDLEGMLQDAVDKYGYTVTESELRQQYEAELHTTKEKQKRLIASVSDGILTQDEAKEAMTDIRAKIARIERELNGLGSKVKAREDYIKAIEILRGQDIKEFLEWTMENETAIFRQVLGLIFKPNSIKVETYRVKAHEFDCRVIDYQFTDALVICKDEVTSQRYLENTYFIIDLAQLFKVSIAQ